MLQIINTTSSNQFVIEIEIEIYLLNSSYIIEPCPRNTRFFVDHRFDHIHLQTICI
jgi:hypothetical protein